MVTRREGPMSIQSQCPAPRAGESCADCTVRLVSVCAALPPDELFALEDLAHQVTIPAKQTIFLQGEDADWVYAITQGVVRLYNLLPDGRRQSVGFALPGDILGIAMCERHAFSADAVEPVTACRFGRAAFVDLVDAKPHLLRRLHAFATHELTLAQDQMMLLGRRTAEEKLVTFLLGLRGRWAKLRPASVTVPLPMSRQDIADFLGLTIETVSRTFTKLAKDKSILIVPGGVRLMNLARLSALAAA